MASLSPFFEFVLAMVILGALVILLATLLWTCDGSFPPRRSGRPNIRHIDARYDRQAPPLHSPMGH